MAEIEIIDLGHFPKVKPKRKTRAKKEAAPVEAAEKPRRGRPRKTAEQIVAKVVRKTTLAGLKRDAERAAVKAKKFKAKQDLRDAKAEHVRLGKEYTYHEKMVVKINAQIHKAAARLAKLEEAAHKAAGPGE